MFSSTIDALTIKASEISSPQEIDYIQDGILYCGHCRTPKQCRLSFNGTDVKIFPCLCACKDRRFQAEREAQREQEQRMRIDSLRADGIRDNALAGCRFENAEETPEIIKCRRYAEKWQTAKENNVGLLLWGGTGNGKTFTAACIANYLIDRGIPALITSFSRILGADFEERRKNLEIIRQYPLLVVDDFGTERATDFALETVYAVVDERYKSKRPLIVTTNLSLDELRRPQSIAQQRIYERVLEMCTPIAFRGESRRQAIAKRRNDFVKELLL